MEQLIGSEEGGKDPALLAELAKPPPPPKNGVSAEEKAQVSTAG